MYKSIKKNFIYNMIYEVLILAVPLVTTPYISRVLGVENIGIYNYVTANITYFTLIAAFGSTTYAQREIAICRDKEKLSEEFWGVLLFRVCSSLIAILSLIVFCLITDKYRVYYLICSISIISVIVDISWFFQGQENFKVTVARNIIIKVVATLLIFIFVKKPDDLILYFLISVCSVFLGSLSLWHFIRGQVQKVEISKLNFKKHFFGSLKLFIPVLAIQVYTVVDKTMLGILSNVTEVGYYSQPEKLVKLLVTVIDSLAIVLLPRLSSLIGNNKIEEAKTIFKKAVSSSVLIALPCVIGCIVVSDDLIPVFLGDGYDPSINVLRILSFLIIILGIARVIGTPLLIPLKREKKYTIAVCMGAIVNLCLNYFLIPVIGAIGAAIATIAAEGCVTILQMYYVSDVFSYKTILKSVLHYLPHSIVMLLIILFVKRIIPDIYIRLIASIVAGVIVYIGLLIFTKDAFFKENILNSILGKISHK